MKKQSRMEANREIRRVLNRHYVDLSYCQYSASGRDIRLTGWLCKHDGSEFNTAQVEAIIFEFQRRLPGHYVTGDMENWNFSLDHIIYLGKKESKKVKIGNDQFEDDYDSEAS